MDALAGLEGLDSGTVHQLLLLFLRHALCGNNPLRTRIVTADR
jgi:hypothetical protein